MADSEALQKDVAEIKSRKEIAPGSRSFDPWQHPRVPVDGAEKRDSRQNCTSHDTEPQGGTASAAKTWPLRMHGLLGAITFKDRMLFDDKVMLTAEYQWDGIKDARLGRAVWSAIL